MARSKLNPRQEKFARLYVRESNARLAYIEAGYASRIENGAADACASRLLSSAKVAKRIEGIRRAMAKRADITEDSVADKLEQAFQVARDERQGAAMTGAAMAQAKLAGLIVERREVSQSQDFERMSIEELRAFIRETEQTLATPKQTETSKQVSANHDGSETVN